MAAIASAARQADWTDVVSSAGGITANPCFAKSFLWGAGVGTLLGGHRLKQGGSPLAASGAAALGAMATLGSQWYLCRQQEYDRKLAMRAYAAQAAAIQAGMGTSGGGSDRAADYAYEGATGTGHSSA